MTEFIDLKDVECGDIVKTPFGYMIVEGKRKDGGLIGHKLS